MYVYTIIIYIYYRWVGKLLKSGAQATEGCYKILVPENNRYRKGSLEN